MLPKRDLEALLANIPKLQAEEQLLQIQSVSMGSGNLPRGAQQQQFDSLRALIDGENVEPKRSSPAQMLAFAQLAKVKVEKVKVAAE